MATGGFSSRWPVPNPALVAPVNITYEYEAYRHPMYAEFTGRSISVQIPPDYTAGFNITNPQNGSTEVYMLRSIELRKPGRVPEGASQVLSHIFEAALVHQEMSGTGYWANVVVPFQVGSDVEADFLSPLVASADLPKDMGEVQPVLVSGARTLDLNEVWRGATFLHFWTQLPTTCQGRQASARQLMRTTSLTMTQTTFHSLLDALQRAPEGPPVDAPQVTWRLGACPVAQAGGAPAPCSSVAAENLAGRLSQAQQVQSTAVGQLREKKALMDQALVLLENSTSGALSIAIEARNNLRTAQAELDSIMNTVADLDKWTRQAQTAAWDSAIPVPTQQAGGAGSGNSSSSGAGLNLALREGSVRLASCRALGRSPVDIVARSAVSAAAAGSPEPLRFHAPGPSVDQLRITNGRDFLRVEARPASEGHATWLGTVAVGGAQHQIAYVDLHVPAEHTIDGRRAAAELQITALPADGGAFLGVSLPLALGAENGWLGALRSLPEPGLARDVAGGAWAEAHGALAAGSEADYFRYDGTTTRAPCGATHWFVLERPGSISRGQLEALLQVLPNAPGAAMNKPFLAGLVVKGAPLLVSQAGDQDPEHRDNRFLQRTSHRRQLQVL